jgi:hypothetical protein
MATILERQQALYLTTLSALESARAASGPNIAVGGVSVDRAGYIKSLEESLKDLEAKPGVVPDLKPTFEVFG